MTPEMDVDVGGTPEPETVAQDMAMDGESDAIVQQLERGLPRWEGFSDAGWSTDIPKVCDLPSTAIRCPDTTTLHVGKIPFHRTSYFKPCRFNVWFILTLFDSKSLHIS